MPLSHVLIVYLISFLLVFLPSFGLAKMFEKAGVAQWKAFIPFYNTWVMQDLARRPKHWVFWQFIPVVGWFITPGIFIEFVKLFGRYSFLDHVLAALFAFIYFPYLGYSDKVRYIGYERVKLYKKPGWREWVDAAVFAIVAATLIRTFVFEAYTIPSGSMEKTLLINDFLFVSKFSYGPRIPNTPLSIPFVHNYIPGTNKKSYSTLVELPYIRWFAAPVQRRDVVVFNFPAGDTVINLPEYQSAVPYYDVIRGFNGDPAYGRNIVLNNPDRYPLAIHPADKSDNYIKRCTGVSGDTLEVKQGWVYINGVKQEVPPKSLYSYTFKSKVQLDPESLKDEFNIGDLATLGSDSTYRVFLPYDQVANFARQPFLRGPLVPDNEVYDPKAFNPTFPYDTAHWKWTVDNYGPIWIPKKGATLALTPANYSIYQRAIRVYEHNEFEYRNGQFILNGKPVTSYTFKMNYYWMMGDNRHESQDSRYWGFVPEDRVVGKAWLIWFSWENGPRWNRLFRIVK